MKISSHNEWDQLRSIVVGSARNANWPSDDPVFAKESERTLWKETPVPSGPVPQWVVDEAEEELDSLCDKLRALGVEVYRPAEMDFVARKGMYNYCPRDRLLIAGEKIVDTAMLFPCRDQEIEALGHIIQGHDVLAMPRDRGMVCDAANIARLNDDWIFLESDTGNRAAYDWLCETFPDINIELVNFYAGAHIDSTITPLREGLVLLNGSRVNESNCPKSLEKWDKIYVDEVVPQGFYQYPYASKWIALNMLVVNPTTVIMDADQPELRYALETRGFEVIPHKLSHSRTLGGGFHCVTLDLWREHA